MKARRSGVVLVVTGLSCLASAAFPLLSATADAEPGSGFGSFSLAANAPTIQVREDYATSNCSAAPSSVGACEGDVNESVSTLRNGPAGHALASFGWPGTLGGNLGSLLIVAGGGNPTGQPVPDQATVLNDPVRAENFTNGPDDTVTNTTVPGTSLTATATATKVAASSVIGAGTEALPFGRIQSSSRTVLTGEKTAEAVAHSEVQDVTIGPLHLGTVVSDAKATTDGTTAVPTGHTTVTGASVNGIPVTIDEHGITVQAQNQPFPAQVTDGVNTALANAGMTVVLSSPTGKPVGSRVTYDAGSVIVVWKQQGAGTATVMVGGASVTVASSEGFSDDPGPVVGDGGGTTGGTTSVTPGTVTQPLSSGTTGLPTGAVTTATGPAPVVSGPGPIAAVPSALRLNLPHGLSPWLAVLTVAGAGLFLAGLRRLPDQVLATPANVCPRGESA